ncbi:unnamed protein product [Pylaiella littoralis]
MAPLKLTTVSLIAVLITIFDRADCFVGPVPIGRSRAAAPARAGRALTNAPQSRPQQTRVFEIARRRPASMSAPSAGKMSSSGTSREESVPPPSRLSRISGRVRKLIRKAIMGYVPEEEVSYKQRAAQQAAAAAKLRGEPEIADERLRGASVAAKASAIEAVEQSLSMEEDDDDILNSGFVQLNIGDQSPMEAEDKLASLRRRLEQGLPPDTAQEQAEKKRMLMQQQQRNQRSSKPASFDGDTAVAERPATDLGAQQANQGSVRPKAPKGTPKLAAAEDVERLNRMFGSMGGEPLR